MIDSIISIESTPDFQGYNHKGIRQDYANKGIELPIQKRVTVQYLSLIDHAPTGPSTVLTAMIEVEKQTEIRGQKYIIFTVDQQIEHVCTTTWWYAFLNEIYWMCWIIDGGMWL